MNSRLTALFAATGAASVIYLIVWWQMLQVVIGSAPVAAGIVLGSFTAGMSLGIVTAQRVVSSRQKSAHVIPLLQIGIAVVSLAVPGGLRYIDNLHSLWLRAIVAAVFLLLPAVPTGVLFRISSRRSEIQPTGFFYASALAGAAAGCVLAGFYLLPLYDVTVASVIAAGINLCAAALGTGVSRKHLPQSQEMSVPEVTPVWISIGLSSCAALGAHAIWKRLLALELATSIYSFSLVLSLFLVGLAVGAFAGLAIAHRSPHRERNFAICQILVTICVAWSAYTLIEVLPYWTIDPKLTVSPWVRFQIDIFRLIWVVLPPAFMWGASLPLAGAAAGTGVRVDSTALLAAGIGTAFFGLLFIPWLGTKVTQQLVIAASTVAAVFAAAALPRRVVAIMCMVFTVVGGAALMLLVSPAPAAVIAYGPSLASNLSTTDSVTQDYFVPKVLMANEGRHSSIAVSETSTGVRNFHLDGKIQSSSTRQDLRLHRMLGHLSGLLHARPRTVLIAGVGAALTAGSFSNHPTVEKIVVCETEPDIARMIPAWFGRQNSNIIDDPRLQIINDDARHYLLATQEKFDIIASEPTQQLAQMPAGILTDEYFELVKRHLNPGGIFAEAIPLQQNSEVGVKASLATFFETFPDGTVWSNDVGGKGYDLVLLGGNSATAINVDAIRERLNRPNHANVLRSLQETGIRSAIELLATYELSAPDIAPWLKNAEINSDRNLRVQYLAGLSVDRHNETSIYDSLVGYRHPPGGRFTGSQNALQELSRAIDERKPRMLSESQASAISRALLSKPPARISISVVIGDQEALQYASALRDSIVAGGWQVGQIRQLEFSDNVAGLQIFVGSNPPPPEANELFQALRDAGFTVERNFDPKANRESVLLVVGTHP
jgi:spermidine synthase